MSSLAPVCSILASTAALPLDAAIRHPVISLFVLALGACVGSFLNVVIYRLPLNLSVSNPKRSFCPSCKTQIPAWQNLPILKLDFAPGQMREMQGTDLRPLRP